MLEQNIHVFEKKNNNNTFTIYNNIEYDIYFIETENENIYDILSLEALSFFLPFFSYLSVSSFMTQNDIWISDVLDDNTFNFFNKNVREYFDFITRHYGNKNLIEILSH